MQNAENLFADATSGQSCVSRTNEMIAAEIDTATSPDSATYTISAPPNGYKVVLWSARWSGAAAGSTAGDWEAESPLGTQVYLIEASDATNADVILPGEAARAGQPLAIGVNGQALVLRLTSDSGDISAAPDLGVQYSVVRDYANVNQYTA